MHARNKKSNGVTLKTQCGFSGGMNIVNELILQDVFHDGGGGVPVVERQGLRGKVRMGTSMLFKRCLI